MSQFKDDERVSERTKQLLSDANYNTRAKKIKHKHYKKDALMNMDYNLLENQYVVRRFVEKKFKLSLRDLEILLYLYPKGYFSLKDYKMFPLSYTHRQITSVISKGFVKIFHEGENKAKHVYTLSKSAKHMVVSYYKYLSGELQVPISSENNPLVRKDASNHEKKIINMFKEMRKRNRG